MIVWTAGLFDIVVCGHPVRFHHWLTPEHGTRERATRLREHWTVFVSQVRLRWRRSTTARCLIRRGACFWWRWSCWWRRWLGPAYLQYVCIFVCPEWPNDYGAYMYIIMGMCARCSSESHCFGRIVTRRFSELSGTLWENLYFVWLSGRRLNY